MSSAWGCKQITSLFWSVSATAVVVKPLVFLGSIFKKMLHFAFIFALMVAKLFLDLLRECCCCDAMPSAGQCDWYRREASNWPGRELNP